MIQTKPPPAHRVQGHLALKFHRSNDQEQTGLHVSAQRQPLRVIRAFHQPDGAALAHLHNVSGGVLGGDHLSIEVEVGAGARAQLTTPGATRIYRHRDGYPMATQTTTIRIALDGLLEFLPDSIIPFAQARYQQQTQIALGKGAGLFWWEIVAPGRVAYQEAFAYDLLEMKTDIRVGTRPIALERLRFGPNLTQPSSLIRMGPYTYWATFFVCRAGLASDYWLALEEKLSQLSARFAAPEQQSWGVSALVSDGLIIRGLSIDSQSLLQGLIEFWRAAKQELYQAEIYLPRKLA